MIKEKIRNEYFEWLCSIVTDNSNSSGLSYKKLLTRLFDTDFEYVMYQDCNRFEDGCNLRYRFAYEHDYGDISDCLDDRACSILEMMVALCIRCEEHIMDNPNLGNRTGQWFWNMIVNLGLGHMSDETFDSGYVDDVLLKFINRDYAPDGKGGLVTIENCRVDLRDVEIWYQMCWYLNSVE